MGELTDVTYHINMLEMLTWFNSELEPNGCLASAPEGAKRKPACIPEPQTVLDIRLAVYYNPSDVGLHTAV